MPIRRLSARTTERPCSEGRSAPQGSDGEDLGERPVHYGPTAILPNRRMLPRSRCLAAFCLLPGAITGAFVEAWRKPDSWLHCRIEVGNSGRSRAYRMFCAPNSFDIRLGHAMPCWLIMVAKRLQQGCVGPIRDPEDSLPVFFLALAIWTLARSQV